MAPNRKKLLLVGRSGSGKSSMRSIIFSNYSAFDTHRLGATIDIEHSHLRILGNMMLNLWDCGGQSVFIENYLTTQRDHMFKMVQVLIYVFDISSKETLKDMDTFQRCLENLQEFSPKAKVYVLLHKMDLVRADRREKIFNATMESLYASTSQFSFKLTGFMTSIWDESLYKAWSTIVCSLIKNLKMLEEQLNEFARYNKAEEVVLIEKSTFLSVSHVTRAGIENEADPKRFEKISNIIKSYRQSCSKIRSQWQSLVVEGASCTVIIDVMTANTVIMAVLPAQSASTELCLNNIRSARQTFERIEQKASLE